LKWRPAEEITMTRNGGGSHIDCQVAKHLADRHDEREFSTAWSS
jgi:ornithine cyclodeaminase